MHQSLGSLMKMLLEQWLDGGLTSVAAQSTLSFITQKSMRVHPNGTLSKMDGKNNSQNLASQSLKKVSVLCTAMLTVATGCSMT